MILREKFCKGSPGISGYGSHLLVFLRLNTEATLFRQAGGDLLQIMDELEEHQKQEIMAELFKCAELQYDSTHYLPYLIGQCWLHIPPSMQGELVPEMQRLCNSDHPETVGIITAAACEILGHFSAPDYDPAGNDPETAQKIRQGMSGMLCRSTYSDRKMIAADTVFTIGYDLFRKLDGDLPVSPVTGTAGPETDIDGIREPLVSVARSVLVYLLAADSPDPLFRCLTVQEIARYLMQIGASYEDPKRPVAFFSGSFDPFSSGNRAMAREIAEMGFQVYINVHDFAWNRNTQPLDVRRKIVMLSVADLAHVRIFPAEIVINTENPADLQRLQELFPCQKVYLVCSGDRIERSHIYQKPPCEGSVHSFPHIVYTRHESEVFDTPESAGGVLTGEVIHLRLPVFYEYMTSLQIRRNLQEGRSIDGMMAIPARQYIRRRNLYADERIYKKEIETRKIETCTETGSGHIRISLQDEESGEILGELLARSRENTAGSPAVPGGRTDKRTFRELEILSVSFLEDADGSQPGMLLDEALLVFQSQGFEMVYIPGSLCDKRLLKERGFMKISGETDRYYVSLKAPLLVYGDISSRILEPFAGEPSLEQVLRENERSLRMAVAGLYPGNAVLYPDRCIMNDRLVKRIHERCGIPEETEEAVWAQQTDPEGPADVREILSDRICVPFGKFQRNIQIPGVVTMALNTEKVYAPDLQTYEIRKTPGAPDLSVQISYLRSMQRPFIIVGDFYNNGYWLHILGQGLSAQSLREEGLIVGVVSGHGLALARENGIKVDAVYEVHNLKAWLRASDLTPFFERDRVLSPAAAQETGDTFPGSRLPSISLLLPYQMPPSLKDAPYHAVYGLSMTCLKNSLRLFSELEALYEARYSRRLTLEHLEEVIESPGCPETVA